MCSAPRSESASTTAICSRSRPPAASLTPISAKGCHTNRARGSTIARRAGEPRLRRTEPIRQRRRTDISRFTSFPMTPTRLGKKMNRDTVGAGTHSTSHEAGGAASSRPSTATGPEPHLTDEPLLLCRQPLHLLIGPCCPLSTPRTATFSDPRPMSPMRSRLSYCRTGSIHPPTNLGRTADPDARELATRGARRPSLA